MGGKVERCLGSFKPCSSSGSGLGDQGQGPAKVNRWPCHLCSVEARGGSRVAGRWDLGGFLGLLACRFGRVPVWLCPCSSSSGLGAVAPWPPSPSLINPCLATKQPYPYATPATATPPHVSSRGEQWPQYVCQREGGLKMFVLASGKMGNLGLVRVSSSSWKCSFYWLIRASTRGL